MYEELGYVLICQVKENEKYVVLKMLLQRRVKAQKEIKMDQSKDCHYFQFNSIHTILLKQTRNTISLPLGKLINKSFEIGIFPDIRKVAKVVPIFKSETRLLCNNYRPISLFSNIGKIIEKLMHQGVNFYLEQFVTTHSNLALD